MPAMWIDRYLARVGYDGPREASPEVLRALHEKHLLHVPFENLDIHWKRPIVVDEQRFIAKIVDEQRGGFCYELNGAFAALLRALGFDVTLLSGRVMGGGGHVGPPFDHMALLVVANDGSRWLADVGFGDSFFSPLRLDARGEQHDRTGTDLIEPGEDEWRYSLKRDGAWSLQYLFSIEPHALNEYSAMCDYQQSSPDSHFTKNRICSVATEDGRITLTNDKLIATHNGMRHERAVSADEWPSVLESTFGIRQPLA
jgi:N-hydroxyarylamine O-acetyltransferase